MNTYTNGAVKIDGTGSWISVIGSFLLVAVMFYVVGDHFGGRHFGGDESPPTVAATAVTPPPTRRCHITGKSLSPQRPTATASGTVS